MWPEKGGVIIMWLWKVEKWPQKGGDDIIVVFMVIKIEINGEKAYL